MRGVYTAIYLIVMLLVVFLRTDIGLANPGFRQGELLIKLTEKNLLESNENKIGYLSSLNVEVKRYYPSNKIYLTQTSKNETVMQALKRLRDFDTVDIVEPNYIRKATFLPNDPLFDQQDTHQIVQSPRAWDMVRGSKRIPVAVIDSGIDFQHVDLSDNLWKNLKEDWLGERPGYNGLDDDGDGYVDNYYGMNAVDNNGNVMDVIGHGTHVAGIIGAVGNNGIGVAGVNHIVSIMALKMFDDEGNGSIADEITAIEYAQKNSARIINMSFGGYEYSEIEKLAIESSVGILFIASAGNEKNDNNSNPMYPASYRLPNIISVSATDKNDNLALFSNFGTCTVDIAAPGVNVLSTVPGDSYKSFSGTSMSAPVVAGVAGLILASNSGFNPDQVKSRILRSSDPVQGLHDATLIGGRVNAYQSLIVVIEGPHIYRIFPDAGPVGSNVAIYGSEFGFQPGQVLFNGNHEAVILSWNSQTIMAAVPEGVSSGPVTVLTKSGISNGHDYTVTTSPAEMKISFPHLIRTQAADPLVLIANPHNEKIMVAMKFLNSDCGINTQSNVFLNPFEKRFVTSGIYDEECYEYSLVCVSNSLFGAAVVSREDPFSRLIVMPHTVGVSLK